MPTQIVDVLEDGSAHVVDEQGRILSREDVARRYYAQKVVLRNDSDVDFDGPAAIVDGISVPIPAGKEDITDLGFVFNVLGNPYLWGGDHNLWTYEYERLNRRFGNEPLLVVPSEQIEREDRMMQLGRLKPEDVERHKRPVPHLTVIDRETGSILEPTCGWPLYNQTPLADSVAERTSDFVTKEQYQALESKFSELLGLLKDE